MYKAKKSSVARMVLAITVALAIVMALAAPVAQAATPAEIEAAIEDGLVWLADQQGGAGPGNGDGSWVGLYNVARTGLAVLKFETHAAFMGLNPLDPAYVYSSNVADGLNFIFNSA